MTRQRRMTLLSATCLIALSGLIAPAARAETLMDAIALAYQNNPTLRAQRESQRALDEGYVQAQAGLRPSVALSGSASYASAESSTLSRQVDYTGSSATVSVSQSLYTGGRIASQISAAEANVMAGRQGLRSVETQVLSAAIQAYIGVRRDQEAVAIATENVAVLKRQLEESNARFTVGEITRTDVAQSEARLAAAQAGLASAQAQLAVRRSTYADVIGQAPGELAPQPSLDALLPAGLDQAYDAAERENPQYLAALFNERAAAAQVVEARSVLRPTVSLRGSATASGTNAAGGSAFNVDYGNNYAASVNLSYPLFQGGYYSSTIRQAERQRSAKEALVEQAKRDSVQRVTQAWNQLQGARSNIVSNQEQVRATRVAYEGVRQESQVGLRTTLDVLNAQQELRNAELALVNAEYDAYLAATNLLAAVGKLEAKPLSVQAPIYDPVKAFKASTGSLGWLPWDPVVKVIDGLGSASTPKAQSRPSSSPR